MMKKIRLGAFILAVCLIIGALFSGNPSLADTTDVTIVVDGQKVNFPDQQPYINSDNRTLIPIRFVTEALGADVDWQEATKTVLITKDGVTVKIVIGRTDITVTDAAGNEKTLWMDTVAVLTNRRTMAPLRFISQAFGYYVGWDKLTRTATITSRSSDTAGSYHIGLVTLALLENEDAYRGAQALIAKYGSVDNGGMVKHVVLPNNVYDNYEQVIPMIAELADDPLMKAIIVNPGIPETAAAFQKIRDSGRGDIFLMTVLPQDDPTVISQVADVVVDQDNFARGYYDILRAKNMGAQTFVFMSFPRHMSINVLARRRLIYEQACKDLGIDYAFVIVPDPANDIGVAGAQQAVYEMMPGMVDKYGTDAVYLTTNTALHGPVIKRVIELGAMFVAQEDMSPLCGFPDVLGLNLYNQDGDDWQAIVKEIEADIVAKGAGGRVGTWPISFEYAASIGLCELAMDMIEGRATGNVQNDLVKAFQAVTPGCDWMVQPYGKWVNDDISNYFLLSMDTYIFGKGYSGVFSEPFPEKYYNIDVTY